MAAALERIMPTPVIAIHEFLAQMTYGYDRGVTEIVVTPSMYERIYLQVRNIVRWTNTNQGIIEKTIYEDELPPAMEIEGIRVIRGRST